MSSSRVSRPARALALSVAAALGAVSLAACGGGSGSSGSAGSANTPVTISFMEAMGSGSLSTAMKHLAAQFQKQNPNVTVTLDAYPDYGTLSQKVTAATSAGSPPTIAQVYNDQAATLASSKVIVPLNSYAAKSSELGSFYAGIKKDLYLPDGKVWMWPFNKSTVIMYFNPKMLSAAHQQVPTTWAQFASVAKAVSGNGVTALSIDPGSSTAPAGGTSLFEILAQSYGSPAWKANGQPDFDSPAAVQALNYLVGLKNEGALAIGSNYPGQVALGAQKGAFDLSSVASYYYNQQAVGGKFKMGTAALPEGANGPSNQLAGTNIVMFDKASDAQKAAAWKFMTFLDSPKQQAYWAQTTGYLPVTSKALPYMTAYLKKNPYQRVATEALQWALDTPPFASVTATQGDLAVGLQQALSGAKSPQAALAAAQQQALAHASGSQ